MERRAARHANQEGEGARAALPAGVKLTPDVSFGQAERQRFDVYAPDGAKNAPVIFMVHGGAWRFGDKKAAKVVDNKVARWVPKGFIFISANYRMVPEADPLEQARDVARALAMAQSKAATWGGDPSKFILMGHSAGAHLVALLTAAPGEALKEGARPWLGVVCLDSAALDLVAIMEAKPSQRLRGCP
jgi:acetyl esterase/lipase